MAALAHDRTGCGQLEALTDGQEPVIALHSRAPESLSKIREAADLRSTSHRPL